MTQAQQAAVPRASRAPGAPWRVSLLTHRPAAAEEFYGALFGWEFEPGPGRRTRALLDGQEVAGIGQSPPDRQLPAAWTPFFTAPDVDLAAGQIRLCGGTVAVGPLDSPGEGRTAVAADPAGAVFGLREDTGPASAPGEDRHGLPVWTELITYETERVVKFYETVCGYAQDPAPPDHVTLLAHGHPVAALHGAGRTVPRDRGAHWLTHFRVTDVPRTVAQLTTLGGRVLEPARPGTRGRVATVADPEGAVFAVLQAPA
ncbi:VOC family protein [Streptomyces sp. LaPpAH-108]|uniref:VOC family protein n=1 Tax=Streptomyces sp. LaPpAH-108 TaxID=1155714 RepID=UPI00035E52F4|nr:VOC family protein [Streptomyces sp. LaPpAH-108]